MTINLADNTPRIEYSVAQGVTQTTFAVPFEFFDNADLTVYVDGVEKTEGSDYTVIGGDGSTGQVLMSVTGGTGGSTVVLVRDIAIERTTDFTSNAINRAALNTQLDTIIGMIADLDDKASRTLQISDYEVAPDLSLPSIDARKGATLAFNESTGAVEVGPTIAATNTVANIAADISAVAANNADVSTVADNIVGVSGIAANLDEILLADDSAAAAAASATASANSATASSGYASASSGYADAALLSMNTAIAAKNAAETAETNAAASATAAASSEAGVAADALAATNAASAAAASQTSAAASAATATTKASEAEGFRNDSATNAATSSAAATNAQLSATNAAASATAAASSASLADSEAAAADASASAAFTSATNASESASTATQQAALAAGSATSAATSATAAAASATSANNDKLAAQAAATSATNTAAALTGFDLEAIAASKAVTAVDVFVYDTSKDSDGGAWRKRTQHTSWYNETLNTATRGSRREFPAVAVIVAESSKVTIYDGDDPALPMWMVFTNNSSFLFGEGSSASIAALNGIMFGGFTNDAYKVDFVADSGFQYSTTSQIWALDISRRNTSGWGAYDSSLPKIISRTVNDVAMTVLPDAPIDPATGLPVPTIAVATDGGCSIIQNTGTVVDSGSTAAVIRVEFSGSSLVWVPGSTPQGWWITDNVGELSDGFSFTEILQREDTSTGNYPQTIQASTANLEYAILGDNLFSMANYVSSAPRSSGFYLYKRGEAVAANKNKGMIAKIQSGFNTGWMNGDIKGAFLSSTDTASLVGSGELVTNGTFDTDTSGWTAVNSTLSIAANKLQVVSSGAGIAYAEQTLSGFTVGQTYILEATGSIISGSSKAYATIYTGTGTFVANAISNVSAETTGTLTFVASQTSMKVRLQLVTPTGSGDTGLFDNISVKLADADRSVNNKGLIVNGTVTRSPVATGAELVAYSGFSSSNYLEQPYNSALDFGTGDFCVMGWFKTSTVAQAIFTRAVVGWTSGVRMQIQLNASGYFKYFGASASLTASTRNLADGVWHHWVVKRASGVTTAFIDGVQIDSTSDTDDLTDTSAVVRVGNQQLSSGYTSGADAALLRISATAPTPEQIKKIYEDEKVLFQENAAATLYGTSDAVTALAHDEDTGLLHVGTSAGRSVFQGLRRVSNTTTAVGTAISASNGMIAEE